MASSRRTDPPALGAHRKRVRRTVGDWLIFAAGTIAAMVAQQKCACPLLRDGFETASCQRTTPVGISARR
jgi:hypothetical protein